MAKNTNINIEKTRKLVVVGDGMCGKTSLLYAFMHQTFDPSHTPTIFDTYAANIEVDNKKVKENRNLPFEKEKQFDFVYRLLWLFSILQVKKILIVFVLFHILTLILF
jgi:small GTP-binding protein